MRVLVTGGGGFLGSWVCRQLLQRGDQAVAFQRGAADNLKDSTAEIFRGDITDLEALKSAMRDCDAVIHVAGKAGAWGPREDYYRVNVTGTEAVIEACRASGIRWLVFTSSPSVVHGGGDIENGNESLPYPDHYAAAYPETKALAEQKVMAANDAALQTVSLRPHLVWGPGDQHLLPRLIKRAKTGTVRLPGADKLIDTVYVENAANAHLLALDALQNETGCAGKTYFISNAEPLPQKKIIADLLQAAGQPADVQPVLPAIARAMGAACEWSWTTFNRKGEPPLTRWSAEQLSTAHWYDISAARRDLGYEPEITISEGLRRLRSDFSNESE